MVRSPRPGARGRRDARSFLLAVALLVTMTAGATLSSGPAHASARQSTTLAADDEAVTDDEAMEGAAAAAVDYLLDHQRSWLVEPQATPDVVSAIAQDAQTGDEWSAKEAIDAVSLADDAAGSTALDALDASAQDDPSPAQAAVMITRAVVAMGLDPENFDPAGDGTPVDLVRVVAAGRRDDGSYGNVRETAEAVLALVMVGRPVNDATVSLLEDTQQRNGGWHVDDTVDDDAIDPTTTAFVIQALVAAGAPADGDGPAPKGMRFLARVQNEEGGWSAVRGAESDPVATAWVMGAIRAAGHDPSTTCWRDAYGSGDPEPPASTPAAALIATQAANGSMGPALDTDHTTAVGVQGLLGRWLPTVRAETVDCGGTDDGGFPVPPSLIVIGVIALVLVVGGLRIIRSSG